MKVLKALYTGYCWTKAIGLSANEEYVEALEFLDKSERYRLVFDGEYLLKKGFLYGAVGRLEESIVILHRSIDLLNKDKSLNIDEKNYLIKYALQLVSIAEGKGSGSEVTDIDFKNVASHYKRIFPL